MGADVLHPAVGVLERILQRSDGHHTIPENESGDPPAAQPFRGEDAFVVGAPSREATSGQDHDPRTGVRLRRREVGRDRRPVLLRMALRAGRAVWPQLQGAWCGKGGGAGGDRRAKQERGPKDRSRPSSPGMTAQGRGFGRCRQSSLVLRLQDRRIDGGGHSGEDQSIAPPHSGRYDKSRDARRSRRACA